MKIDNETTLVEENSIINSNSSKDSLNSKRTKRSVKNVPLLTFEDALVLANGIWSCASGQKVRRLTLFDHLKKSPDSGPSRGLITASSKYGLTNGGYQAEFIELTPLGRQATDPDGDIRDIISAKFQLSIQSNIFFKTLYDSYKGM